MKHMKDMKTERTGGMPITIKSTITMGWRDRRSQTAATGGRRDDFPNSSGEIRVYECVYEYAGPRLYPYSYTYSYTLISPLPPPLHLPR